MVARSGGVTGRLRALDQQIIPPMARVLGRWTRSPSLVTSVVILAILAVALSAWIARDPLPNNGAPPVELARVGAADHQSVAEYAASSRTKLQGLSGRTTPTYALVSLTAYLAPDRLATLLTGVPAARVFLKVPFQGVVTEAIGVDIVDVPTDVVTAMEQFADRRGAEALDYQQLSDKLNGDQPAERRSRDEYHQRALLASREASALRSRCSCVYGVVVLATPERLSALLKRTEVRVVDPAPEVARMDQATFAPVLPEQPDDSLSTPSAARGSAARSARPSAVGPTERPVPSRRVPPSRRPPLPPVSVPPPSVVEPSTSEPPPSVPGWSEPAISPSSLSGAGVR